MILLLIILSTIHGVITMKGDHSFEAELSEFVVSIWYMQEHKCTGSILDSTHVLTSGNCVVHLLFSSVSVAAGITRSFPRNIQLIPVNRIHFHPDFQKISLAHGFYWENNIAVLELSDTLKWETTIAAVPLIDAEYNWDPCYTCQTFGWDDKTVGGVKLLILRWSLWTIAEDERCDDMNVTLWKNEKCMDNQFQTVLEDGDYGAPLVCGSLAVGIMLHGGTEEGSPSVLLSIYPYLDFIASILLPMKINVPGEFPYYVALFYNGNYHCGGSIIDSTHIVTAGHCVEASANNTLVVLFGRSEFLVDELGVEEFRLVSQIYKHPNFQHYKLDNGFIILQNDIAVVEFRKPFTWSANVRPIGLADSLPIGEICQAHRWSRTVTKQGRGSTRSLSSPATLKDYDACRFINPYRQETDFCVVNIYSLPITTRGDSGSPMVCDGIVVGVLSSHTLSSRAFWGPYQGMYYTSIYPHLKFINDAVAGRIS